MTHFYSHLLSDLEKIDEAIGRLPISQKEKGEARMLVQETIHHTVIDIILEHLPEIHHERILFEIYRAPHNRAILDVVKNLSGKDVEVALGTRLQELQIELLADLTTERGR